MMIDEIAALLLKSQRSCASARRTMEAGDCDFAVSRAYYAMFYAAEALLLTNQGPGLLAPLGGACSLRGAFRQAGLT